MSLVKTKDGIEIYLGHSTGSHVDWCQGAE